MRAVRVEFEGRWYGGVAGEDGFRLMPTPELEPVDVIASEGWSGFSERAVRPVGFSQGRLLSPIARPGKILSVGLNYRDHIEEQGLGVGVFMDPPTFLKAGDTVTVSVERVGELTNPVDAAPAQDEKPRVFGGRVKGPTGSAGGQR